jgi:sugar transferase (PEP-CTERM/EpsH1 system associated)
MTRPLVVHIIQRLAVGGLENGLVNLVNHMDPGRFRHAIVCLTDYTDFRQRVRRQDVEVFALHKRPGKDPLSYVRLFSLLKRLRPEIVHTRNAGALDCVFVAWCAGVPARIHGWHGWTSDDVRGTDRRRRMVRRAMDPLVSAYVTVSADLGDWLEADLGVAPSRTHLIRNGVDTDRFRPPAGGPSPRAGDCLHFGYVGRLDPVKNLDMLVDAVASLIASDDRLRQRLRVAMIGDGPMRPTLQSQIETHGLGDCVSLPGPTEDVAEAMRGMDVFVLPSLNEGISNTLLEAMASGLPAVATRVGGNPELVAHGETGLLTEPESVSSLAGAMRAYLDDGDQLVRHGRAARERAEDAFSLARMVAAYEALYAAWTGG